MDVIESLLECIVSEMRIVMSFVNDPSITDERLIGIELDPLYGLKIPLHWEFYLLQNFGKNID